jgi:hypothetical protein
VLAECVAGGKLIYCYGTEVFIYHEASPKHLDLFCK